MTYALADLVTNVLIAPLSAIAAAVMYFQLLRLHGEAADAAAGPAGARRPRGARPALAWTRCGSSRSSTSATPGPASSPTRSAARAPSSVDWVPRTSDRSGRSTGYDAVLVFGGAMHADQEDRHPWLRGEKALLRELLERGVPMLGVCLGAQLVAEAAGARAAARAPSPRSAGSRSS